MKLAGLLTVLLVASPLTFSAPAFQSRHTILVTPSTATINVGASVTLSVDVQVQSWSSSHPGVASVSSAGVVTGRSAGTATITAKAKNLRGTSVVTVTEALPAQNPETSQQERPPPTDGYGPQSSIACPNGAVSVSPSQDLPAVTERYAADTAFCLAPGTYPITRPVRLKARQQLIGHYGAVLDGSLVQSAEGVGTSVISGWNCTDCAGAVVRNLVILGRDRVNCIGAYGANSGGWTVDNNELSGCRWGVSFGRYWEGTYATKPYVAGPIVRGNYLHHNVWSGATGSDGSGAYGFQNTRGTVFTGNRLESNGGQSKWTGTVETYVANNWVRYDPVGIWLDGDNLNAIVEGNLLEDQAEVGIFYEISATGIIRHNRIYRSRDSAIFISTSRDMQVYGNYLEHNWRGVNLFVNCEIVGAYDYPYPTAIGFDLRNNDIHHNMTVVGTQPDVMASAVSHWSGCTSQQIATYMDPAGEKRNVFRDNTYRLLDPSAAAWFFAAWQTWSQWQALGYDVTGTLEPVS